MDDHTRQLAEKLKARMAEYLDDAHLGVVPSGMLGAGMEVGGSFDPPTAEYDQATQTLFIRGAVQVRISRAASN